jgi:hypothetical protein
MNVTSWNLLVTIVGALHHLEFECDEWDMSTEEVAGATEYLYGRLISGKPENPDEWRDLFKSVYALLGWEDEPSSGAIKEFVNFMGVELGSIKE